MTKFDNQELSDQTLHILMKRLGYQFHDYDLLMQALTHRSAGKQHNERLEFLGDAVLQLIISEQLYQDYPESSEGALTQMRATLVNRETLSALADELEISDYLQLGAGEIKSGGRSRPSTLANTLEAVVGALYLDEGWSTCAVSVSLWFKKRREALGAPELSKNAKSRLQEWLQAHQLPLPEYQVTRRGEQNYQTFTVVCRVDGLSHETQGVSAVRREAEKLAALRFLELLDKW